MNQFLFIDGKYEKDLPVYSSQTNAPCVFLLYHPELDALRQSPRMLAGEYYEPSSHWKSAFGHIRMVSKLTAGVCSSTSGS
jgi:hypothetical protein